MKAVIAGSRSVTGFYGFCETLRAIEAACRTFNITISEVVSGTAKGADRMGERFARLHGLPIKRFPADWERYGKRAGMIRNKEMAHYADVVICVWDGRSPGTRGMIDYCKGGMIPCYVHRFEPPPADVASDEWISFMRGKMRRSGGCDCLDCATAGEPTH